MERNAGGAGGESVKKGMRRFTNDLGVWDGREEKSGVTPGVRQGGEGSVLSALETDRSKGALPEEEGQLANFAQAYVRWLNKSPLCRCLQGVHTSGGQGLVLLLFHLTPPLPLSQHPAP